jgi:hypothetical protein
MRGEQTPRLLRVVCFRTERLCQTERNVIENVHSTNGAIQTGVVGLQRRWPCGTPGGSVLRRLNQQHGYPVPGQTAYGYAREAFAADIESLERRLDEGLSNSIRGSN